jgi:hypothetical protein
MITPEDRERLAKSKFGEWFDEFFEKKFEESFQRKLDERTGKSQAQSAARESAPQQGEPAPQVSQRRRSLLEECLSNTFGF